MNWGLFTAFVVLGLWFIPVIVAVVFPFQNPLVILSQMFLQVWRWLTNQHWSEADRQWAKE